MLTGQLRLAWILLQGEQFILIADRSKIKNLEVNVAVEKVKLTKAEIDQIRQASENAGTAGERYMAVHSGHLYKYSTARFK